MRRLLFSSLFFVTLLILALLMKTFMPKYSGMLFYFFIFLLLDCYLWFSVRKPIKRFRPFLRISATVFYWLPAALLICMMVCSFVVPFPEWNLAFRTYIQNCILIFFVTKIFPIITLITADLFRLLKFAVLVVFPGRKAQGQSIPRFWAILVAGWILGGLIFMTLAAGTIFWQFDFRVKQEVITLKELPPSFDGFKIVQFSDVHLGSWGVKQKLQKAMDEINGLNPDVIFFTGDMFNYCTSDGKGFEEILKTLRAPCGIYAIMGNHDYGDYISWPSAAAKKQNIADLVVFYKNLGWKLLLNTHDILKREKDSIAIVGVENWGATSRFQRLGNLAVAQRGTEGMAIQLLLSHDPSHWDSIVSKKYPLVDLTFSGHTHGGQVGIDCCNIHWSPVMWISRFWSGLYQNPAGGPAQFLYVNQGLGNIAYSGRVGILPEITLVVLKTGIK